MHSMEELAGRLAKLEAAAANITSLESRMAEHSATLSTLPGSVDSFFLLSCGALVFFMQATRPSSTMPRGGR